MDGYFSAAKLSKKSGGGGNYGYPDIAVNSFLPMGRDRVAEKKKDVSVIDRLNTGLAVPSCQSQFIAGTARCSEARKEVCGLCGSKCNHNIMDDLYGMN